MSKKIPPSNGRNDSGKAPVAKAAARNTDNAPASAKPDRAADLQAEKMAHTQALAAAMPFNSSKPAGPEQGLKYAARNTDAMVPGRWPRPEAPP